MSASLKRKAGDVAAANAKKAKANTSITSFFKAPKPAPGVPGEPAVEAKKFDKEAWYEKLTDEQKELLKLEFDTLHETWLAQLKDEILKPSFLNLKRFLKKEKDAGKVIFPPMEDVYSW